jgi:hypothetical protein
MPTEQLPITCHKTSGITEFLYQVCSTFFFLFLPNLFVYFPHYQDTNHLPHAILLDFSCIDNLETKVLKDSYHRTCLNYAWNSENIYQNFHESFNTNYKIRYIVRGGSNGPTNNSNIKNGIRHIIKFQEVVPHLVRLLHSGGIWTIDCDEAYMALVRCRIEQVCYKFIYMNIAFFYFFSLYLTGYSTCCCCLCRPGREHQQSPSKGLSK